MTEIQLAYGTGSVVLPVDESVHRVLTVQDEAKKPLTDLEINDSFDQLIDSPALDELFAPGDSVLIVTSDATRATASAQIVNLLVRRLIALGVSPGDFAVIFATGLHRSVTPAEKSALLTPFIVQRVKTLDHDAYDSSRTLSLGHTSRGTPIELNRAVHDYTHTIIIGAIGFHYFAGFTGGRKSICPGLASAKTIKATHMLALDPQTGGRRDGVETAKLAGNAVHEECDEVAAVVTPTLGINSVVDDRGRAVQIFAGNWRTSHAIGCSAYLTDHSVQLEEKRPVVIASCGGSPYDINLIQAHKTLDMAARACIDGGDIVLLAQCSDGLGRADFLKWFESKDSMELIQRLRTGYEVNGQTAWSLLTKTERYRVHLISDLPDEDVRCMRMQPSRSLKEVMAKVNGEQPGFIMPRGAAVLPQIL